MCTHACCLELAGEGLLWRGRQRICNKHVLQRFFDALNGNEFDGRADCRRDFGQVPAEIEFGQQHALDALTKSRQRLLLDAANRQHRARQCNFARHRGIRPNQSIREQRRQYCHQRNATRGAVLANSSFGKVHVQVNLTGQASQRGLTDPSNLVVAVRVFVCVSVCVSARTYK